MSNLFTSAETGNPSEPAPPVAVVSLVKAATPALASSATSTPQPDPEPELEPGEERRPPLWSVMPVTDGSGASTLDRWCACSREVARNPAWAPEPDQSPYLVLATPRTVEGIRRARQLAGALASAAGGSAQVAAIVAVAAEPSSRGGSGGLQLKEMMAAAESAGVQIITAEYSPQLAGQLVAPAGPDAWSPHTVASGAVPEVLARVYTRLFFIIADRETGKEA